MTIEEIEKRIPHRSPMRLLDEIVTQDDSTIHCRKTFHEEEFFVQGHFPDHPIVPGVIQCECCLQAGAILLSAQTAEDQTAGDSGLVPVATRMDSVKFKRMVRPGDTVDVHVTLNDQVSNAYFLTGKMMLAGKLTARLDFACSIANPQAAASGEKQ
ncbi:MAG: 3-hydroxyacyl-ACP dehydratase FabZ family protein [Rubripirellula sp.]